MKKIVKILNNNAVIINDDHQEKIAIGTGIGFNKTKNDPIHQDKIEKLFILEDNEKLEQLLLRIPEEHFTLAEEIISHAEEQLQTRMNSHILLALTDHLSFSIERQKQGIHLKNKLIQEIKVLYRDEYRIGLWAINLIKERLNLEMPIDEAAYIALHLHTMKIRGGDLRETIRETAIIRDMVDVIQTELEISIQEDDLAYERLITHLRFALNRSRELDTHSMDAEMLKMIQQKFQTAYECALTINSHLQHTYGFQLPEEELGYITLHIERLSNY